MRNLVGISVLPNCGCQVVAVQPDVDVAAKSLRHIDAVVVTLFNQRGRSRARLLKHNAVVVAQLRHIELVKVASLQQVNQIASSVLRDVCNVARAALINSGAVQIAQLLNDGLVVRACLYQLQVLPCVATVRHNLRRLQHITRTDLVHNGCVAQNVRPSKIRQGRQIGRPARRHHQELQSKS